MACHRSSGFSLVELLVAALLGALLLAAWVRLYASVERSSRELQAVAGQAESARFALQLLGDDLRRAGDWAGYLPPWEDLTRNGLPLLPPPSVPDPCKPVTMWTESDRDAMVGLPVQVYPEDSPDLPCDDLLRNRLPGSDVLVLRFAAHCTADCEARSEGHLYLQLSGCPAERAAGRYFALRPEDSPVTAADCTGEAESHRFVQHIYYLRDYFLEPGDGMPTLMRSSFGTASGVPAQQRAEALVAGLDGFRVGLGVDHAAAGGEPVVPAAAVVWGEQAGHRYPANRGDGVPDGDYVYCETGGCATTELLQVVTARVTLLVRSALPVAQLADDRRYVLADSELGPFGDGFHRRLYQLTVPLEILAGRRVLR